MLDVGDGQRIRWEVSGNPDGRAAVALHGGPGSGCAPGGASCSTRPPTGSCCSTSAAPAAACPTPRIPAPTCRVNTTHHLIADIERLRAHLGIERWLVIGGSWGSTLALAYAQRHPERVTEIVLFSVATTTRREVEWLTRGVGRLFPRAWARFAAGVPDEPNLAAAYARALADPDRRREQAARDWCAWEDTHVGGPHDPPALRRPPVPGPLRAPGHPLLGERRVARGDRAARRHARGWPGSPAC